MTVAHVFALLQTVPGLRQPAEVAQSVQAPATARGSSHAGTAMLPLKCHQLMRALVAEVAGAVGLLQHLKLLLRITAAAEFCSLQNLRITFCWPVQTYPSS